jgi:hypothetical protein
MVFDAIESGPFQDSRRGNLFPDPHGQQSLRPSFSMSSMSPWTKRKSRFTCVSDGYPLRRFELTSKAGQVGELVDAVHDGRSGRSSSRPQMVGVRPQLR